MGSKAASARLLECHPSYLVHLLADPGRKVGLDFAFALQTATEDWEEGPIRAEWWRAEVPASTGTDD
ncbi:MAG: hypothetical protein K8H88_06325 [Sandaracinaceae bacterium]|nr:hypothetical protein [Sandaracinaceae bacterium]